MRETLASRPTVVRAKGRIAEAFIASAVETMRAATPADLDRFFGRTDAVPGQDFSAVTRLG